MVELNGKQYECPSEIGMEIVDDKWKFYILWHLIDKPLRIVQLSELIPQTSSRTITRKLKELEEAKIVDRIVHAQVPPKVEYALTEHGKKLLEIFSFLEKWGEEYVVSMGGTVTPCEM